MKILMITPYYPPCLEAEAIVNGKLAKELIKRKHELTVVTVPHHSVKCNLDESDIWREGLGQAIYLSPPWHARRAMKKKKVEVASKIAAWHPSATWFANASYKHCRRLIQKNSYDLLISRSPSIDTVITAAKLKEKFSFRWIAGFNDPCPFCLCPPPYDEGKPRGFRERYEIKWLGKALSRADFLLFPSQRLAAYMFEKIPIKGGNRTIIMPHIGWKRNGPAKARNEIEILSSGVIWLKRVHTDFFNWCQNTIKNYPQLGKKLIITILGRTDKILVNYVNEHNLQDLVRFEKYVPFEESLERHSAADFLLLLEAPFPEGIFLPSKFCDYVAADKPLLMFSPEKGTIADHVGGFDHPGFLGQSEQTVKRGLDRLFRRIADGRGLDDYRLPDPHLFDASRVVDSFLEQVRDIIK